MIFSSLLVIQDSEYLGTPKSSAGEITIVTPENKTYTQPDSGYYPATFGFENDIVGAPPEYWEIDQIDGSIQIIENLDQHKNILDLYDGGLSPGIITHTEFLAQNYGTVEFWWRTDDITKGVHIGLSEGIYHKDNLTCYFYNTAAGDWRYQVGTTAYYIPNVNTSRNNKWHHFTVHFECTTSGYQSLNQYSWNIIIDGIESGELSFKNNKASVNRFTITTSSTQQDYHEYFDSLGYSWDPNYSIGDNLNEGLLLSYDNNTALDWKGYSLDGQANKTILGNTTIPMPADGIHNIQVFGNDSVGTMYESDEMYFTVNTTPYLDIITPENKTYTEPDSGYYPATYGFEDVKDGALSTEWIDSSSASCTAKIIGLMGGHRKVYELYDNNPGGYAWIMQNWSIPREKGTIELYVRATDASVGNFVQLRNDTSPINPLAINFGIYQNKFQYTDGVWKDVGYDALPDTWYHIRFDWETTNEGYKGLSQWKWKIEIDGIPFGPFNFENNIIPEIFSTNTRAPLTGFYWYIDDVSYSWDPNYNIGDNLNEGLLLSYDVNTDFNWTGYSLDGQTNITILGNTTIPMPADGLHRIQVFGNDSIGTIYESDVRYFTIATSPPEITINSPTPSQTIGTTAPNYDISITGLYDSIWYTLDGGTTNITENSLTGTINQAAWTALADGIITIIFFANNSAGVEESAQVQVIKDSSEEPPPIPPGIPGYNLYLLIGALGIISALVIRKRLKS